MLGGGDQRCLRSHGKLKHASYEINLTLFMTKRHLLSVKGLEEKARTALESMQLFDI